MHKIKPGKLTAKTVKSNFKEAFERLIVRDNTFLFIDPVKGTPVYWKQFLYDVIVMVKQLEIPTYFLTLSYADLK